MNILLLGSTGQLGFALQSALKGLGVIQALGRNDLDLNLATEKSIEDLFLTLRPNWVVNASAYTAVDLAESKQEAAFKVNAIVPELLAKSSAKHHAGLIHFSTDFVFDGEKKSPYVEGDNCRPLSVYGQSKRQGELAVQEHCPEHLIFRTGWLMGPHGGNFLKTMLRLASTKPELKVIADQFGAPTPAAWLAAVTQKAIQSCESIKHQRTDASSIPLWGLYHASGAGEISWHQYAKTVIEQAQALDFHLALKPENVLPIPSSSYPLPAKRPAYSVLDCHKLRQAFKVEQPIWHQSIVDVLKSIQAPH